MHFGPSTHLHLNTAFCTNGLHFRSLSPSGTGSRKKELQRGIQRKPFLVRALATCATGFIRTHPPVPIDHTELQTCSLVRDLLMAFIYEQNGAFLPRGIMRWKLDAPNTRRHQRYQARNRRSAHTKTPKHAGCVTKATFYSNSGAYPLFSSSKDICSEWRSTVPSPESSLSSSPVSSSKNSRASSPAQSSRHVAHTGRLVLPAPLAPLPTLTQTQPKICTLTKTKRRRRGKRGGRRRGGRRRHTRDCSPQQMPQAPQCRDHRSLRVNY
eukprot:jgi/Bigna1/81948/fgenesh1_pg.86_\